jgi:Na+-driven multidrug efflux pump
MIGPMALAASMTPFVGQNLGARQYVRVRHGLRFSALMSLAYGAAAAIGLALLAPRLAAIFTAEPDVIQMTTRYLRIVPLSYGLFGAMFAVNSTFNAANHPLRAALLISLRLFVLAVPLALLGAALAELSGVFAGISLANIVIGLLAIVLARRFLQNVEKKVTNGVDITRAEGM